MNTLTLRSSLWLMADDQSLAGPGRIELLERIGETGSIRQAALAMGMSYRAAWDAVEVMNLRSGMTLVARVVGGRGGGGAQLTAGGHQLIQRFRKLEAAHARYLARVNARLQDEWSSLHDGASG